MQVKQQINVNFWEAHFTKILSWEVLPKKSPFRVELQEVCRISERLVRKDGPVIASRCGCLEMEVSFLVWRNSKYTVWTEEVRQEDRKTKFMPLGILEWLMWSTGREGVAPQKNQLLSFYIPVPPRELSGGDFRLWALLFEERKSIQDLTQAFQVLCLSLSKECQEMSNAVKTSFLKKLWGNEGRGRKYRE